MDATGSDARAAGEAKQPERAELFVQHRGQVSVCLASVGGPCRHATACRLCQPQREWHRCQRKRGQAGRVDEHRHDQGDGEQQCVPGLDHHLADTECERLDVADHPRHHPANRHLGEPIHWPREHASQRVSADVRLEPRPGNAEPPALADPRHLRGRCRQHERDCGFAHGFAAGVALLIREHSVDRAAQKHRRQNDEDVHQDPAHGSHDEQPRHLAEVRSQLPEEHRPSFAFAAFWRYRVRPRDRPDTFAARARAHLPLKVNTAYDSVVMRNRSSISLNSDGCKSTNSSWGTFYMRPLFPDELCRIFTPQRSCAIFVRHVNVLAPLRLNNVVISTIANVLSVCCRVHHHEERPRYR